MAHLHLNNYEEVIKWSRNRRSISLSWKDRGQSIRRESRTYHICDSDTNFKMGWSVLIWRHVRDLAMGSCTQQYAGGVFVLNLGGDNDLPVPLTEEWIEELFLGVIIVNQCTLKKGLEIFGEKAEEAKKPPEIKKDPWYRYLHTHWCKDFDKGGSI